MADDTDPLDPGVGADGEGQDPGTEAENRARDLEGELLDRQESPEDRINQRVEELSTLDISNDVAVPFWAAVVYANAGLFLISLGPLLAYFRGQTLVGGAMVVAGLLALWRTYSTVRTFRRERARRNDDGDGPADRSN